MRAFKLGIFAAVLAASVVLPIPDAGAARLIAWYEGPYFNPTLTGIEIKAHWHAWYADPRCPQEPRFDDYDDTAHGCVGLTAYIGFIDHGVFVYRGEDSAATPEDDYHGYVRGVCREEREVAGGTPGSDYWLAFWQQEIHHRPDHHEYGMHYYDDLIEVETRYSNVTRVPRCRIGRLNRV